MHLDELAHWFEDYVRPFLDSYAEGRSASLANELRRWRELSEAPDEVFVCLLGNAGIGKSTLLNALVSHDRQVLPSGGIGPLTAQATSVRYAERPFFRAWYHTPGLLWRLIFPIESAIRRAESGPTGGARGSVANVSDLEEEDLTSDELSEVITEAEESVDSGDGRYDALLKQARILIAGNQFSEVAPKYVADCLRLTLKKPVRFDNAPTSEDQLRIARLQQALEYARKNTDYRKERAGDPQDFFRELKDHTAGHLAPLLREIEVGWPSELLRDHLVLVDLPGIGVASDAHKKVTQEYVRTKARAIVVVVDRAGMTEAVVNLLRQSGYWDRVVGAGYEPGADPCAILVAVTRVDDVAEEEWANSPDEGRPSRRHVFAKLVEEMRTQIRAQTADQLKQLQETDAASQSPALAQARQAARDAILEQLRVFPLSAPEFRRISRGDDEDRPHIARTPEDTQVPQLGDELARLAAEVQEHRGEAIRVTGERFSRGVHGELAILEEQWKGEAHALEEVDQLRRELEVFMVPLREQQANRQGAFREFLQVQNDAAIPALVQEARRAAEQDIRRYLSGLGDCHWATLRAAVRRGGAWFGARHIDLPNDIATRFQEPVAGVWGVKLLKAVRQRTKEYATATVAQVDEVCDWARKRGVKIHTDLFERERQRVEDRADQLRDVGREAADELRDAVKSELYQAISKQIRRKCEAFVERGDAIGPGVKHRILVLFEELAEDATNAAEPTTQRILIKRFNEVREQVDVAFGEWKDPLKDALDAVASTHEQRVRRADVYRRKEVFAQLAAVRANAPQPYELATAISL